MPETTALIISIAGSILVAIGLAWYLIKALQTGYIRDLFAPVMTLFDRSRGLWPFLLMLAGGVIAASPLLVKKIAGEYVDEKPKIEVKSPKDIRMTLTGVRPEEFETRLKDMKHLRVLQWANPGVTDAHLELLKGMDDLVELDLNDAKITDAGLAIIATLPKLERLRIARTGITDDGFRKHILPLKQMEELDLTMTPVKPQTLRDWTDAKIGRKRPST